MKPFFQTPKKQILDNFIPRSSVSLSWRAVCGLSWRAVCLSTPEDSRIFFLYYFICMQAQARTHPRRQTKNFHQKQINNSIWGYSIVICQVLNIISLVLRGFLPKLNVGINDVAYWRVPVIAATIKTIVEPKSHSYKVHPANRQLYIAYIMSVLSSEYFFEIFQFIVPTHTGSLPLA